MGLLILSAVGTGLLATLVSARPQNATRTDERISIFVSALMDRNHVSEMKVNDEISRRAMDMFFERLDARKRFFLQSDIDQFSAERELIDDYVKRGDVSLAKRIFDVFLQRVDERIAVAQQLLDEEHDFTLDEEMVFDPDEIAFAKTKEEADEQWRKKVKFDILVQVVDEVEYAEAIEKLHKRYRGVKRRYEQTDSDELLEWFLTAVTMSFDPHSTYMSPKTVENFNIMMRLQLDGIGASLLSEYGETIVKQIVPGGAADKDGRLQIEDVIVAVAQGEKGEFVDIVDMKINDVVHLIRGEPGTIVRLQVNQAGNAGSVVYDITRAHIELKDKEARSQIVERRADGSDPNETKPAEADGEQAEPTAEVIESKAAADGSTTKIGVLSLPSFYMDIEGRRAGDPNYKSTARDMRRLLEDFNRQEVDLVIMDLRTNGGGSLPESVEATGLFIDQGPVVQVKGPDGRVQPYLDDHPGMVWKGPLVVVINKFSASASEIFAGAIQDYGRGIVVGDRATHGKGTVQSLVELGPKVLPVRRPNWGALKMTIQKFYRPSGDSTQNRGVLSDVELPFRTSHWEVGESDLDFAMEFDRIHPIPHANYRSATAQVIQQLKLNSAQRCEQSEFFSAELLKIERYLEQKENPTVTLNKEKFVAEREKLKDQENFFDDMQDDTRPVFPVNPYNEELIAISLDYLELLGENRIAVVK
ncbi:MAG: tail-specific protease [Planctomycetes bacterium]|nr:tail-specific protease [Planctomycetota bacterium]